MRTFWNGRLILKVLGSVFPLLLDLTCAISQPAPPEKKTIPQIAQKLKDSDMVVRQETLFLLSSRKDTLAISFILTALNDPEPVVRRCAVDCLSRIKDPDLASHILPLLEDRDWTVRMVVLDKLAETKDAKLLGRIRPLAQDPEERVRWQAKLTLALLGDSSVLPELYAAASDPSNDHRRDLMRVIPDLKPENGYGLLQQGLKDSDITIRSTALQNIRVMRGDETARQEVFQLILSRDEKVVKGAWALIDRDRGFFMDILSKLLEDPVPMNRILAGDALSGRSDYRERIVRTVEPFLTDSDPELRGRAALCLGSLKVSAAIPELRSLLTSQDCSLKSRAASLLTDLKDTESIPVLKSMLSDSCGDARLVAIKAMGRFKVMESIDSLTEILKGRDARSFADATIGSLMALDARSSLPLIRPFLSKESYPDTRARAIEAVDLFQDRESIPALLSLLDERNWGEHVALARALGHLQVQEAVPGLIRMLSDESGGDPKWIAAMEALGDLKAEEAVPAIEPFLKYERDYRVVQTARETLLKIGSLENPEMVRQMFEMSSSSPESQAFFRKLAEGSPESVARLLVDACLGRHRPHEENFRQLVDAVGPEAVVLEAVRRFSRGPEGESREQENQRRYWCAQVVEQIGVVQAVPALAKGLRSEEGALRAQTSTFIAQMQLSQQDARPLLPFLDDGLPGVRELGVRFLRLQRDSPLGQRMAILLSDPDPGVRLWASIWLSYSPPNQLKALSILEDGVNSPDTEARIESILGLGRDRSERAERKVLEARKDENPRIRRAVAKALAGGKTPEGRQVLLDLVQDPDPLISAEAACSLRALKDPKGLAVLLKAMESEDRDVRSVVMSGFTQYDTKESIPPLMAMLIGPDEKKSERASSVLFQILPDTQVPQVVSRLSDPRPYVRAHCVFVLMYKIQQEDIPKLIALLDDSDPEVKKNVMQALWNMNVKSAAQKIVPLLSDPAVAETAESAIITLKEPSSYPLVKALLSSQDPKVRDRAANILRNVGYKEAVPTP